MCFVFSILNANKSRERGAKNNRRKLLYSEWVWMLEYASSISVRMTHVRMNRSHWNEKMNPFYFVFFNWYNLFVECTSLTIKLWLMNGFDNNKKIDKFLQFEWIFHFSPSVECKFGLPLWDQFLSNSQFYLNCHKWICWFPSYYKMAFKFENRIQSDPLIGYFVENMSAFLHVMKKGDITNHSSFDKMSFFIINMLLSKMLRKNTSRIPNIRTKIFDNITMLKWFKRIRMLQLQHRMNDRQEKTQCNSIK